MNEDVLIGGAMLAIGLALVFFRASKQSGVSPRFIRFETALVLYPPVVLVFVAGGIAEIIVGLLRIPN